MFKRTVSLILLAVVTVSSIGYPAYATIQDEKDALAELEQEKTDIQAIIDELDSEMASIEEKIEVLDGELTTVTEELYTTETELASVKKKIKKNKKKLKKAKKKIKKQYAAMKLRIQFMYENGDQQMIDLILNSDNVSDFLNQADYISELSTYDREQLDELKATKQTIEDTRAVLVAERDTLKTLKAEQETQQTELEALISAKQTELAEYDSRLAENEAAMDELDVEIGDKQELIAEMERIEEERRQQQSSSQVIAPNTGYMWPIPGFSYISSDYGYRSDPFSGAQSFHSGIDVPAPAGTPIVATNSGQVAWSNYSTTAGNWVGIDHGNGVYSVYMHMSSRMCSTGDYVTQGQTIGLVGTTGSSTGNHLHFSIRINGVYTSPWNYISR